MQWYLSTTLNHINRYFFWAYQIQLQRVLKRFHEKQSPISKHGYLNSLQDRNETLFFRLLMENIDIMAPIIYTPTVGDACLQFGREFRRARGMHQKLVVILARTI